MTSLLLSSIALQSICTATRDPRPVIDSRQQLSTISHFWFNSLYLSPLPQTYTQNGPGKMTTAHRPTFDPVSNISVFSFRTVLRHHHFRAVQHALTSRCEPPKRLAAKKPSAARPTTNVSSPHIHSSSSDSAAKAATPIATRATYEPSSSPPRPRTSPRPRAPSRMAAAATTRTPGRSGLSRLLARKRRRRTRKLSDGGYYRRRGTLTRTTRTRKRMRTMTAMRTIATMMTPSSRGSWTG